MANKNNYLFGCFSIANVDVHISTHLNLRAYICQYCGKRFNLETVLKDHVKTHTGEKNYRCDVCPKAFRKYDTLRYHRNMHNNVKPYPCPVCNKAFRQKGHITSHMRIHVCKWFKFIFSIPIWNYF